MTSSWYLGHVTMNWGTLGIDEDGDMSMRASHSSYLEHRRGRVVEYAIRKLDGDPYASGERGLSGGGWDSEPGKLVGAGCTNIFTNITVNQIKYYSPGFDSSCIKLASTVAGSLSLFVGCFCSNVGNGTPIQTGGALAWGESSDVYDESSSLSWNSSGGDD